MIRQPPTVVPNPIASAQATITQVGTSEDVNFPDATKASVMIPITF